MLPTELQERLERLADQLAKIRGYL